MRRIFIGVLFSAVVVLLPTYFVYQELAGVREFWSSQNLWSGALALCWAVVAMGYFHQGWLVRTKKNARDVSLVLPVAVFFVQCILFVKGVFYGDWSLMWGALVVNSGVLFSMFSIVKVRAASGKAGH